MADLFDNPMGLMGFEFVEFASPEPGVLEPMFERLGFTHVANHRSKNVALYRQGGINFIVNREPLSPAAFFAVEHGPCACAMAFRVRDSHHAYARALQLGAQPLVECGPTAIPAHEDHHGGGRGLRHRQLHQPQIRADPPRLGGHCRQGERRDETANQQQQHGSHGPTPISS